MSYDIPEFKFALREDLKTFPEFLPSRAEPNATGWDVRAAQISRDTLVIEPFSYFKIPLGFRAMPETGWWFYLHPRSSSLVKRNMHNLIGIIDEDFPMEVLCAGQYIPHLNTNKVLEINFGDPIAQLIPVRRQEMLVMGISNEEYDDLFRGKMAVRSGGFGSTG